MLFFVLHSLLFSICLRCAQRKAELFYTWAPGCGRSLFFFKVRLEKRHARQHVQYGNQNYLKNRAQSWDQCFRNAHAQLLNTHHS